MEEISIGEFARRSRLSLKALRLYDERGVLVPSRVDQASGYRYYDAAQLDEARLVVMLRQLQLPLAAVKELLACDPADAATRIAEHWRDAEAAHDARRELADYLVSRLRGKRSVMYEVATREMPERRLLCLKRNVDEQGQWAFGKEFIAILRERPLPKIEGREGAFFCIYWSHPSADGDGLIEWCKPVPAGEAHTLAEHYPELTLRTEPAHREAFVALPAGYGAVHWQLAAESLEAWGQGQGQGHEDERLTLKPEDLGLRTTYLATGPSDPGIDLAVPFA
ncbi:MAG TPA: helix-turn-helix domain-containing protein [Streptosporangiaceae bacterium]|nr:helix-turn-helix domain-containing protein [Streptosporangiaceae bacterium]